MLGDARRAAPGRPPRAARPVRLRRAGKRARKVPIIEEARGLVAARLDVVHVPDGRLFTGPRGGRISTAEPRDATHWDEVVTRSGTSTFAATICGTPG